jgi:hypothetical protein
MGVSARNHCDHRGECTSSKDVELLEEAARLPLLETPVRGAAAAQLLGQRVPLAPRPQDVQDGAEDAAIIDAGTASSEAGQRRRDEGLDVCPEGVVDFPG